MTVATRAQALMKLEEALEELRQLDFMAASPRDRRTATGARRTAFLPVAVECRSGPAERRQGERRARRGR